jgi:hypothetical protein
MSVETLGWPARGIATLRITAADGLADQDGGADGMVGAAATRT